MDILGRKNSKNATITVFGGGIPPLHFDWKLRLNPQTLDAKTPKQKKKKNETKKNATPESFHVFKQKNTLTQNRSPFLGRSVSKNTSAVGLFHASPWLCLHSLHHPPKSLEVVEDFEKIHTANVKMVATHQYLHLGIFLDVQD